jgi:transcriptional regulator with XRE-family HTH domain
VAPVADRTGTYADNGGKGTCPAHLSAGAVHDVVMGPGPSGSNRHGRQNYSDAEISATEIPSPVMLTGEQGALALASGVMERASSDPREVEFYEGLAYRLKLAVEAIDRPKGEIADSIGVSQSRFSNWITNQNRPDWFGIAKFCKRYGVSADWILLGDLSGLRANLADSLALALEEKPAHPAGARRRLPGSSS